MREFEFLEPQTLTEALAMMSEYEDDACVYAGGTALLLAMRQRMLSPGFVVSLGKLDELREITFNPAEGLRIGALARHSDVARAPDVQAHYPMLAGMAGGLANPQVRNQGTIGGNLCYADPATDPPSCLIAMDAEVTIAGPGGERRLPMREFVVDFFTTALEPGEILTHITLPPPRPDRTGLYRRHLRTPAEHRPVANVALTFRDVNGVPEDVRLVIGAAVPVAQSMTRAEDFLTARAITLDVAAEAAAMVAEDIDPISDGRGEEAFRRQVVRAITRRILAEAAGLNWKDAAA
ncbi:carbon-monoxide dehydrogenase medium subunit [Salinihabitans flavidus]|uniref:Carbon-monoxide dehydrogenase medium subunit n=1 Tax=Salinihabitans flavidus TaxID=569882 RepID=A0A1H8UNY3_9RHOB|nr:xanthine dehydrogenase family protein subunit M [Salinihabitans flavidus]SEP04318.1 carbon-monoxide dehydrogenase medium subunit [Salinihabitans flavidus]